MTEAQDVVTIRSAAPAMLPLHRNVEVRSSTGTEAMEKRLAIVFDFTETFQGRGYFGEIVVRGRGVLEYYEDDGWTLLGVEPGGMAGCGDTPQEAMADFRETFKSVVYDFALEAQDSDEFWNIFMRLRPSELLDRQWHEARAALRKALESGGREDALDVTADFTDRGVVFRAVKDPKPETNEPAREPLAAA